MLYYQLVVDKLVTTANKLENDRKKKLLELTPKECDEYVESLVLEAYKGYKNGDIVDNPDSATAFDKLNEFIEIKLDLSPYSNVNAVVKDREMRYLTIAYLSAVFTKKNYESKVFDEVRFTNDMLLLETLYHRLVDVLMVYYDNYSNYGFMENLLMDLSDDGLKVDMDIRNKYLFSKNYGVNENLMWYLDIKIKVEVKSILKELDKMDILYLDDSAEYRKMIDDLIDGIHDNIKDFYKKSNNDFEISAFKQTGMLDAELEVIANVKESERVHKQQYLEIRNKIMDLIDGNGFGDISAKKFDKYKKRNPDADFDEWMKKEPKYDVRNAKFIYPEISESEYLSLD